MGIQSEQNSAFICAPDGTQIEIAMEAHSMQGVEEALAHQIQSIAPLCVEELFLTDEPPPDEQALYNFYRTVLTRTNGGRVIARICNFRSDRHPPTLPISCEQNPAMGLCSVRLLLSHPAWFVPQLRALARAAVHGRLAVLAPMLCTVDEAQRTRELLSEVSAQLAEEGVATAPMEIGITIETPAATLVSDLLARYADFFWIDLHNLAQYVLATDRNGILYSPTRAYNKAVLRLVAEAVQNGKREGIWCGATVGDAAAELAPLLAALGVRMLSSPPAMLSEVQRAICNTNLTHLRSKLVHSLASLEDFNLLNNKF